MSDDTAASAADVLDESAPVRAEAAFRLDGRVAIVTGASSGLGRRFVAVLAAAGARVVATARRADRLDALAAGRDDVRVVAGDLTDHGVRTAVVDAAVDGFGGIEVLVNNAGIVVSAAAEEEGVERFQSVVALNLVAAYAMAALVAPTMLARGRGSIINIASMYGLVGGGRAEPLASYAASKGGLISLTRELAAQWGAAGIRVNALAPGYFPTEMTANAFVDDAFMARVRRSTPLRRAGRSDELDGALLFLASDASTYVTGQALSVDGGWTAV